MRVVPMAVIAAVLGLSSPTSGHTQRLITDSLRAQAPAFDLPIWSSDSAATPERLTLNDLRGQVVVIDFWARHCVPCVPIHAALIEKASEWQAQGVRIVSVLTWENPLALGSFFDSQGERPSFPVLLDEPGTLIEALDSRAMPTVAILDHQGRIAWKHLGGMSPAVDLPRLLPPLLAVRDGRTVARNPNQLTF